MFKSMQLIVLAITAMTSLSLGCTTTAASDQSGSPETKQTPSQQSPSRSSFLTKQEINEVVQLSLPKVNQCLNEQKDLAAQISNVAGCKVTSFYTWLIGPEGKVIDTNVEGTRIKRCLKPTPHTTKQLASLNRCVKTVIMSYEFSKPASGAAVTVRYPLSFSGNDKQLGSQTPRKATPKNKRKPKSGFAPNHYGTI